MRGFEQIPWVYDAMHVVFEWAGLAEWRRWLVGGARGRTLDLGCGTGRNLPHYSREIRLVGVDPYPQNLQRARRRAPHVPLVRARAEALPFKDGAFETAVSALVFCSVLDPAKGLAEVRRVLAPAGALRMLEHVRSTKRFWARCQDAVQPAWTAVTGGCQPNRDTERNVERAGFLIEEEERHADRNMRRFQARPSPPTLSPQAERGSSAQG